MRAGPDRSTFWPIPARQHHYPPAARTLAAFLVDYPATPVGRPDASVRTHTQIRCAGPRGDGVHQLDSARPLKFYITGCGMRVAKAAGVLTADAVDCQHFGCRRREAGAGRG